MQELANKFPGTIGDQINAQISALQTQNQSNQELINSLQTGKMESKMRLIQQLQHRNSLLL